jgi:hypothetical protein
MNTTGATPADQARSLGLAVGDTIEGREGDHTARLKLLWVGDDVAVWRYWSLMDGGQMADQGECAEWNLGYRDWVKVEVPQ